MILYYHYDSDNDVTMIYNDNDKDNTNDTNETNETNDTDDDDDADAENEDPDSIADHHHDPPCHRGRFCSQVIPDGGREQPSWWRRMHPPHGKAVVEAPVAVMRIEPSWTKFGGCINHVMGLLYGTYIYIYYTVYMCIVTNIMGFVPENRVL